MKNLLKTICTFFVFGLFIVACSKTHRQEQANYQVIPLPQHILQEEQAEPFVLTSNVKILYPRNNQAMKNNAQFLAHYIKNATGYHLQIQEGDPQPGAIVLTTTKEATDRENPESYSLKVNSQNITISSPTEAGVFYGMQTLRKSLPISEGNAQISFPAVEIKDYPRFAYRGAHLDVSRHFFSVEEIKTYIDMMALHNMNRFHWHLTDDQGWRLEIKKYPKLTEIGAKRAQTVIGRNTGKYDGKPYSGYYTQEQAKEIVDYAAKQYITIIPEVDLPGHMQAALASYPNLGCTGGPYEVWQQWGVSDDVLCAGNDEVLTFLENVYSELIEIFPSEYIHVGGDECPKTRWEKCPKCQARIKSLGLKSDKEHTKEERLQSFVISHIEQFLNKHGRHIIGWDEILEGGLAPNATVMSWRGEKGGIEAAKQKHNVIMTPNTYLYFDYYQTHNTENEPLAIGGYLPMEHVYSYEPMPTSLTPQQQQYIKGVQANLWTEYIPSFAQVQYMILPRWAALSEIQWTMPQKKDYHSFLQRLPQLTNQYEAEQYNYAKHVFQVQMQFTPDTAGQALQVALSTINDSTIYYTLNESDPILYTEPITLHNTTTLRAGTYRQLQEPIDEKYTTSEQVFFNKATIKPIVANQPVNKQYHFKGISTLTDGLKGNNNYRTGRWIAFYRNDLDATIDLLDTTTISSVSINTCVEKGDWVFDARGLQVEISNDGHSFKPIASEQYPPMKESDQNGIYTHTITFTPIQTRYVRVVALSEKNIPSWHGGKGHPGFLFVDEITIE